MRLTTDAGLGEISSCKELCVSSTSVFFTFKLHVLERSVLFGEEMRESVSRRGGCVLSARDNLQSAFAGKISMFATSMSFKRDPDMVEGLLVLLGA